MTVVAEIPAGFRLDVLRRLKDAGTPIGANDLWIACHALAEDATLVTRNTRAFRRITTLRLEDWAGDAS